MRMLRLLVLAGLVGLLPSLRAAEASPAGTWTWHVGRAVQTLRLAWEGGVLTGTLAGSSSGPVALPDSPIGEATFRDGVVRFSVARSAAGMSVTTRYEGRLRGDAIEGTSERPDLRGGAPVRREWKAHRAR